ncbi:MAG: hypothetical protein ACI4OZ_07360 [Akkermansia sp.]
MRLSIANILLLIPGLSFITLADGCSGKAVEIRETDSGAIRVEEVSAMRLFFEALVKALNSQ